MGAHFGGSYLYWLNLVWPCSSLSSWLDLWLVRASSPRRLLRRPLWSLTIFTQCLMWIRHSYSLFHLWPWPYSGYSTYNNSSAGVNGIVFSRREFHGESQYWEFTLCAWRPESNSGRWKYWPCQPGEGRGGRWDWDSIKWRLRYTDGREMNRWTCRLEREPHSYCIQIQAWIRWCSNNWMSWCTSTNSWKKKMRWEKIHSRCSTLESMIKYKNNTMVRV